MGERVRQDIFLDPIIFDIASHWIGLSGNAAFHPLKRSQYIDLRECTKHLEWFDLFYLFLWTKFSVARLHTTPHHSGSIRQGVSYCCIYWGVWCNKNTHLRYKAHRRSVVFAPNSSQLDQCDSVIWHLVEQTLLFLVKHIGEASFLHRIRLNLTKSSSIGRISVSQIKRFKISKLNFIFSTAINYSITSVNILCVILWLMKIKGKYIHDYSYSYMPELGKLECNRLHDY